MMNSHYLSESSSSLSKDPYLYSLLLDDNQWTFHGVINYLESPNTSESLKEIGIFKEGHLSFSSLGEESTRHGLFENISNIKSGLSGSNCSNLIEPQIYNVNSTLCDCASSHQKPPLLPKPYCFGTKGMCENRIINRETLESDIFSLMSDPVKYKVLSTKVASERKHLRMIKDRAAAANHRARKQAYTLQLEAEVDKLKDAKQKLRENQAKLQAPERRNDVYQIGLVNEHGGKHRLRRTQTSLWCCQREQINS